MRGGAVFKTHNRPSFMCSFRSLKPTEKDKLVSSESSELEIHLVHNCFAYCVRGENKKKKQKKLFLFFSFSFLWEMRVVGLGNIPERGQNYIPSFPARPPGTKVPVQNFGCRGFPVGFYIPDIREFSRPTKGACIAPYSLYLGRGTGPQHRSATIVPALEFAIAAMFSSNLLLIRRLYPHVYRKVGSRNRIDITHNS